MDQPAQTISRPNNLRARLRRWTGRTLLALIATVALVYGVDFGIFEIRVIAKRNPYGSVTVNPYYAVLQKNGKTSFIFDDPQVQTCVNAMLPHAGALPCWYLRRHTDRRTDI